MKKMNYTDVIANISNTINAPVKIEKQKNEFIVYTFYVAIAILTVVQLLFLDKFTYFKELITLPNGQIFNSFTLVLFTISYKPLFVGVVNSPEEQSSLLTKTK